MDMPMTRLIVRSFAILVFALPGAAAVADELRDKLDRCNDLADADARLACYDAAVDPGRQGAAAGPVAAEPQPAAPVQAESASTGTGTLSQEDLFGKSGDEMERTVREATGSEPIDSLGATVSKLQRYSYDKVLITLDNGQVWKQIDGSSLRLRVGDAVEIERASLGSFMLKKQGSKRSMRVSRED